MVSKDSAGPPVRPGPPLLFRMLAPVVRRLPRGRFRVAAALTGRARTPFVARLPRRLGGHRFVCDVRDANARDAYLAGIYEPQETMIIRELLTPGATFVDVGANWGYHSLIASAIVGAGRIVAVEPDPMMRAILEENVGLNQLANVTILPMAAWNAETTLQMQSFDPGAGNFGLSRVVDDRESPGPTEAVRAGRLDDALRELGIDDVTVMKMDIEGAEGQALEGLGEFLRSRRVRALLLELHPAALLSFGRTTTAIEELLSESGYRGRAVDHSPEMEQRAHYARSLRCRDLLRSLGDVEARGSWPHHLWVREDVDLAVAGA